MLTEFEKSVIGFSLGIIIGLQIVTMSYLALGII